VRGHELIVKESRHGPAGWLPAIASLAESAIDTAMLAVNVEHHGALALPQVLNINREFNLLNANLVVSADC
jgi:hypothetical protein